ncbi:MAG: tetratricopeptide repeat protein [Steroidobacteraceae bacterium]
MAESGGMSGLSGTEGESPAESAVPEAPTSLDPTAAALAAEAAKGNPELAEKACAYFVKQTRLVEIQTEHLHEQRAVNLQLLKLRRFDERLRVALRLFVILVATVVGIGAVIMIRDAISDHGLVVEAFSVPPATLTGQESEFDELAGKAAEAVYRTSQPYRFAQFLAGQNRNAEAFRVIADLATNGPQSERGWAYIEWGMLDLNTNGDLESARKHCLRGLADAGALTDSADICLVGAEVWSGHDEKELEYSRPLEISAQTRASGVTQEFYENTKILSQAWLATLTGDIQQSAQDWTLAEAAPDYFESAELSPALAATAYAFDHDPDSASKIVAALRPNDDPSFLQMDAILAFNALPAYWIAATSNDWPAALADARACAAWLDAHTPANKLFGRLRAVWIEPLEALAMAKAGDLAGAETLVSATPLDCYLCVRIRGQIAAIRQDWTAAERWFAEAARQAPSLPFAFSEWGEMRLTKGDIDGAIARFETAHHRSPHFADALKGWGDALARQGQAKAALAKYDEALKYAPNWKELKEAREATMAERRDRVN